MNPLKAPSICLMTTRFPVCLTFIIICPLILTGSYSDLGKYNCENDEEITSVASFRTRVEDEDKPFFCLGTMIYKAEEKEPAVGRLLVFTAYTPTNSTKTSSLELSLVTSAKVEGCVYALKMVDGKIVAAVNSSVRSRSIYLY